MRWQWRRWKRKYYIEERKNKKKKRCSKRREEDGLWIYYTHLNVGGCTVVAVGLLETTRGYTTVGRQAVAAVASGRALARVCMMCVHYKHRAPLLCVPPT